MLDRQIDRAIDPTAVRGIGYEPTYSGVPSLFRRPFSTTPGGADIAVLGVPLDPGKGRPGHGVSIPFWRSKSLIVAIAFSIRATPLRLCQRSRGERRN